MIHDISLTAVGTAYQRSQESARDDRLFLDPFSRLLWSAGREIVQARRANGNKSQRDNSEAIQMIQFIIALRTRYFDDFIYECVDQGIDQIVILGSGLDCRPFRLELEKSIKLFEVDLPGILQFKESVLKEHGVKANCEHISIFSDITGDWPHELPDAGFDISRPSAWVIEGVLPYLSHQDIKRMYSDIQSLSAPGSRCGFDDIQEIHKVFLGAFAIDDFSGFISMDCTDQTVAEFEQGGWSLESDSCKHLMEKYGRFDSDPLGYMWVASRA